MSAADERKQARSALSAALAALDGRVLASIRSVPDSSAVGIAERLGEPVIDVRRSLYRLKRAGRITGRGQTRATTYRAKTPRKARR